MLEIPQDQVDAFRAPLETALREKGIAALRQRFPELTKHFTDEQMNDAFDKVVDLAKNYDTLSAYDIQRLAETALLKGMDYLQSPAATDILQRDDLTGREKVDQIASGLADAAGVPPGAADAMRGDGGPLMPAEEWVARRAPPGAPPVPSEAPYDQIVQPCPGPDPAPKPTDVPVPTLTVSWSKPEVTPDHNSGWPPVSAPTDTPPGEAEVECVANTTNVPDGTAASITIRHCVTGGSVFEGTLQGLEVRGGKVVVASTGQRPKFIFDARHDPWQIWDKPWYYFDCAVSYQGLAEETPRDFTGNAAACLRVLYWTVTFPDSTSGLAGVLPESNFVRATLNNGGRKSRSDVESHSAHTPLANVGSLMRNTYAFHVASHGNLVEKATNRPSWYYQNSAQNPPDTTHTGANLPLPGPDRNWRSTVTAGTHNPATVALTGSPRGRTGTWTCDQLGEEQLPVAADIPSVPKYLFYASCCVAGWEPSFADSVIARGCRNVVAFRKFVPDNDAQAMGQNFFTQWMAQNLDPAKIADVFLATGTPYYGSMRPVLFGAAGSAIRDPAAAAAEDVAGLAPGMTATPADGLA